MNTVTYEEDVEFDIYNIVNNINFKKYNVFSIVLENNNIIEIIIHREDEYPTLDSVKKAPYIDLSNEIPTLRLFKSQKFDNCLDINRNQLLNFLDILHNNKYTMRYSEPSRIISHTSVLTEHESKLVIGKIKMKYNNFLLGEGNNDIN